MTPAFFFDEAELNVKRRERPPAYKPAPSGCGACGLDKAVRSPRMQPYGEAQLHIAVVGEAPGADEDAQGRQFVGRAGRFLFHSLNKVGVDLDRDCLLMNAVNCRPTDPSGSNRPPTEAELAACRPRLHAQLDAARPDLILAFGTPAIAAVLADAPFAPTATVMHGRIVPSRRFSCWVACGFHPSWYVREEGRYDGRMDEMLAAAVRRLADDPIIPPLLDPDAYEIVEDLGELERLLTRLGDGTNEVALDFEATGLDPWAKGFKLLSLAVTDTPDRGWCVPLFHPHAVWGGKDAAMWDLVKWFLQDSPCPKIIQNWQYEELALRAATGGPGVRNVVCDTMVREHVLDNRRGVCGQEFQEYVRYGVTGHKGSLNMGRLKGEWLDDLARYNCLDARYCLRWKRDQDGEMTPDLTRAYSLFHDAIPVLSSATLRGIKVDMGRLDALEAEVKADLDVLAKAPAEAESVRLFRGRYGTEWDPKNPNDKRRLFFGILGLRPLRATTSQEGNDGWQEDPDACAADSDSLESCLEQVPEGSEEERLLRLCLSAAKLEKLHGTYLKGLRKEIRDDGLLHPSFHLHKVQTYRSSSSDPNFQNFPKRDKDMSRARRVMVPHHDVFLEADYSGAEVRTLACRTLDAGLVRNVRNNVDFHRKYAAFLYEKDEGEITKGERFNGKSGLIFPEFYGSRWRSIARKNPQWRPERVEQAENKLWAEMPDVKRYQDESARQYERLGYMDLLTGFRVRFGDAGMLSSYQLCNWPMQGPAFHRLLRAMIDVEAEMRRRGMRSFIVGQIHDSLVTDCVREELADVVALQRDIMTRPVWWWCEAVPWEAEFSVGENLIDMKEYKDGTAA